VLPPGCTAYFRSDWSRLSLVNESGQAYAEMADVKSVVINRVDAMVEAHRYLENSGQFCKIVVIIRADAEPA
jgi:hypothetical protein